MTTHFVDNTSPNPPGDGSAQFPWADIRSAMTYNGFSPGDETWCRGDQSHLIDADVNFTDDGSFGLPLRLIGDDGTYWPTPTNRTIIEFANNNVELRLSGDDYWSFDRLHFRNGEGRVIDAMSSTDLTLSNCLWTSPTSTPQTSVRCLEGTLRVFNCEFYAAAGSAIQHQADADIIDTIISGAGIGLNVSKGTTRMRNVAFNCTTDIQIAEGNVRRGWNVSLNGATPVKITTGRRAHCILQTLNGVPGTWTRWNRTGKLQWMLASATPAGQRSGGGEYVTEMIADSDVSAWAPLVLEHQVRVSAATWNVDVWLQPSGGTPPIIDGANAEVWATTTVLDEATSQLVDIDSRDTSQGVLVNDTWGRVSLVVPATVKDMIEVTIHQTVEGTIYADSTIPVVAE